MKKSCFFNGVIWLIIGVLIGAGVMYYTGICKTNATSIQLNANANSGPGITITKTGNDQ
ncbi:MAG: hypothetical protein NTU49_10135 [Gammaproteobacteria bacterium]|nr:hypothetical protein [Gammaproteobacteria bacterium]